MPVLDILDDKGCLRTQTSGVNDAGIQVLAAMAYPNDEVRRDKIIATGLQDALMDLGRDTPPNLARIVFDARGGPGAQDEFSGANEAGLIAGYTLYTLTSLEEHRPEAATLSRAQHLVRESRLTDKRRDGSKLTASRSVIKRAWYGYKTVSHLWAVMVHVHLVDHDRGEGALGVEFLPTFLGIAATLEEFVIHHVAPGAQASQVDDSEIWRVPDFVGRPKLRFSPTELSMDQLRWLKGYRHALK